MQPWQRKSRAHCDDMASPSLLAQIFAKEPRKLVRFPDLPLEAALAELSRLQGELTAPAPAPVTTATVAPAMDENVLGAVAALATHVWRTRSKLVDPTTNEPREETRRAYRHVEAAMESFDQMGVKLSDWLDQPYDPGLPLKVLAFQPTPGLTRDTVIEALRPTVLWGDRLLQLGEVVVGIPPEKAENPL